ncbi:MAG: leucine-rich repeat domain-containing protein, partial [Anaeroplasmataceae bacterium]|nr:leucine-rich repeat domain-containing protein [Anaeroplasmataceae bacterium]
SLYVANQNGNAYYIPTKLAKVTVTDDCDIRAYGFANVNKLQTIVLPNDGYHSVAGAEEAFTEIGAHAFESCSELVRVVNTNSDLTETEIELPETMTTIGDYAFNECVKLPYMIFPAEITTVGSYAFRNCVELQEAIFEGNKIDTLSEGVFYNCIELNEFNFPTSILHVKSYAFYNCIDLDEITVPKNVLDIEYAAFGGCHNLAEMTIPFVGQDREDNQNSNATTFGWIFGGVIVGHTINTPSALYEVRQNTRTHLVPTKLTKVTITDVDAIVDNAFINVSKLETVILPKGYGYAPHPVVTDAADQKPFVRIGSSAFENCTSLTVVTDGETLADGSYINQFPVTTTTLGTGAFRNCSSLPTIIITENVEEMGDYAFEKCNVLNNVLFKTRELEAINEGVFYDCCSLTTMTYLNESGLEVGDENVITILDTVTSLGSVAFYNCSSATTIIVPENVDTVGYKVFGRCINLNSLTIPFVGDVNTNPCDYTDKALTYDGSNKVLGYLFGFTSEPQEGMHEIRQYYNATQYVDAYIPTNLTEMALTNTEVIHYGTFYNVDTITTITLPSNLKVIEGYAFYTDNVDHISSLTTVIGDMNESLTTIGEHAFDNNVVLKQFNSDVDRVIIPTKVVTLNDYAFNNCNAITYLEIPESVGTGDGVVGEYVFAGTDSLSELVIKNHWIGAHMFDNLDNFPDDFRYENVYEYPKLAEVTIPACVTRIDEYAFANNEKLSKVNIYNKVLGDYQFYNCPRLTSIHIPDDVDHIGEGALGDCISLVEIWIPFVGEHAYTADGRNAVLGYIFGTKSKYSDAVSEQGAYVVATEQMIGSSSTETFYIPTALKIVHVTNDKAIGYGAFSNCAGLTTITLSEERVSDDATSGQFESIGDYAFANCESLGMKVLDPAEYTELGYFEIPSSTSYLGAYAFKDAHALPMVIYGGSALKEIQEGTFYNAYSLDTLARNDSNPAKIVDVWDSIENIGAKAFFNCESITEISVGIKNVKMVNTIGNAAFGGCINLEKLTVPFVGKQRVPVEEAAHSEETIFGWFFGSTSIASELKNKITPITQHYSELGTYDAYIPTSIKEVNITNSMIIHYGAFYDVDSITTITLPSNIERIDAYAFYSMNRLAKVNYGEDIVAKKLEYIGDYAFSKDISLEGFTLPQALTYLGEGAFAEDRSLVYANFEDFDNAILPAILEKTFYRCTALNEMNSDSNYTVRIPDSVKLIGDSAFEKCSAIESVHINLVERILDRAFYECTAMEQLTLAADIDNPVLYAIGEEAFRYCTSLESVIVPATVGDPTKPLAFTGDYAFANNISLTSLELRNIELSSHMFDTASSLTHVVIPASIEKVGTHVFANSGIVSIAATDLLNKKVGEYMFYNNNDLVSVEVPANITLIDYAAFGGCAAIEEMTLPFVGAHAYTADSIESLFGYIFGHNVETDMMLVYQNHSDRTGVKATVRDKNSKTVDIMSAYGFYLPFGLKSVTLLNTVDTIGYGAFENMEMLENIIFSDEGSDANSDITLEIIKDKAFKHTGLLSVILPATVDTLGAEAFMNCSDLATVNFEGKNILIINDSTFENCTSLKYCDGTNEFVLHDDIVRLGNKAFKNTGIETIVVPASVLSVGESVFEHCQELVTATILNDVNGKAMFKDCISLDTVTFHDATTVDIISEEMFMNCESLTEIQIPETVELIDSYAFYGASLESLDIPGNVETIESYALGYNNFKELIIPTNVKKIGYSALTGCGDLLKLKLPFIGTNAPDTEAYSTQSGSESLFGYIFGRTPYEKGVKVHQFMERYVEGSLNDPAGHTEKIPFLNEFGQTATYEEEGNTIYGETFYIPFGLAKIEFFDNFDKITNGAMSGLTTVYDVKLPYHIKEIETAAFSGGTNLRYIDMPKPAIILHEAVFENMYENPEENEEFFITASYDVNGDNFPEGWVTGKTIPVPKRWHTKYLVIYEEYADIFTYDYDYEHKTFRITGYTENMPEHVLTHRDSTGRFILRIPETKNLRPIVEITDEAFLDYFDNIPEYLAEFSKKYSDVKSAEQFMMNGIMIARNVSRIGDNIITGGDGFQVFVCRTSETEISLNEIGNGVEQENNYIGDEARWMQKGLVYYGEDKTWTLADREMFQILLSSTDISLDLNSQPGLEYNEDEGYYIIYAGEDFTPNPVIRFDVNNPNTVQVAGAVLPEYALTVPGKYGDFRSYYWNNQDVSYDADGNVISNAWVYVFTNNTTVFTNRPVASLDVDADLWCSEIINYGWGFSYVEDGAKISFKIIQRELIVNVTDSQEFEEGEIWENTDWSSNNTTVSIENFATAGEMFNGDMRLNALNPTKSEVLVDEETGEVIAYTDAENQFTWAENYTITKNGIDLTSNYYVTFNMAVTITPKTIMVAWARMNTEYDLSHRFVLPIASVTLKPGYDAYELCPLTVDLVSRGETIYTYQCTSNYMTAQIEFASAGSYLVVASTTSKNYTLINERNVFVIELITVDTPVVFDQLVFNQFEYINVTISNLFDYFADFECTDRIAYVEEGASEEEIVASFHNAIYETILGDKERLEVGVYTVFAKLRDENNYQWRDYRAPLYREDIYEMKIRVVEAPVRVDLTDAELTYQFGEDELSYSVSTIVDDIYNTAFDITVPNVKGQYAYTDFASLVGTINGEDIELREDGFYYTKNYRLVLSGNINVVYPSLDNMIVTDTQGATYDSTIEIIDEAEIETGSIIDTYVESKAHDIQIITGNPQAQIQFSLDNEIWTSAVSGTATTEYGFTEAGIYTIYFKVTCLNFKDRIGTVTLRINRAQTGIVIENADDLSKVYDGYAVEPEYSVTGSQKDAIVTYHKEISEDDSAAAGAIRYDGKLYSFAGFEEAVNAGSWLLRVLVDTDDNYQGSIAYANFIIEQKHVDITFNEEYKYSIHNKYDYSTT